MMDRSSILHITGLYGPFIYVETVMIYLARLRGIRIIYDVRAGSSEWHYNRRGWIYRRCFAKALMLVDKVTIEGERLVPFVSKLTGRVPAFIPNHLDPRSIPPRTSSSGPGTRPVIAYAGAIKPEKGIETLVEAADLLRAEGFQTETRIAGLGDSAFLKEVASKFGRVDLRWLGALPVQDVLKLFAGSHFFLFPTSHRGEGQSNALTEAMAAGCVPIVSDHGFNAETVGDCGVVLPVTATGGDYARALRDIWESGAWEGLSQSARHRAHDRFSSVKVIDHLIAEYVILEQQ